MSEDLVRTPPHDNVAEQSVLGGMMLSKDAIADVVEVVVGADFYKPAHESIYEAIVSLYGKGEPADAITVADELTKRGDLDHVGGAAYLHSLISSVPTAANAGFYAEIVQERAVLRRLVGAGTKIVQLGYAQDGEVETLVNEAQAEIMSVAERRNSEDYVALKEVVEATVDEIEQAAGKSGMQGVPSGFVEFDELTHGLQGGQMIVVAARPAMGKALALDTPIPTPTGWSTMGDLEVGDYVLAADGSPTRITQATGVMTGRPCYRVTFDDGAEIVADAEHQWLTLTRAARRTRPMAAYSTAAEVKALRSAAPVADLSGAEVVTTEHIRQTLRCNTAERRLNHSIPNAHALQLPEAQLPIAPYTMGIWLGDGATNQARITTVDPEVLARVQWDGYTVRPVGKHGYGIALPKEQRDYQRNCVVCGAAFVTRHQTIQACSQSCGGRVRGLGKPSLQPTCIDCGAPCSGGLRCSRCHVSGTSIQGILRAMGLLGNKHIPRSYLRSSERQRRDLLAGLLDSDGTVTNAGCVQFAVTHRQLAEDFRELVHSLGYRSGMGTKVVKGRSPESSILYKVTFSATDQVFHLTRKRQAHLERDGRPTPKRTQRFVTAVEPMDSVPVRCIEVDNPDHLFLAGRHLIPTHNSTFAIDIARSAAIKHNMATAIFSLEMARNEIALKILSAEATINLQDLRKGGLRDEQWQKIASTMGKLDSAPLFIDDSPNMSLMEIRAKCRRLKQKHDLKLVVLDYLQLMSSGKRVESRQQEVSEFSRALKLMAKELEVPVIALSQLNRGSEQRTDKRPMVSDLRESGSIEQDADMVILLHRDDVYDKESPRAGEADVIVAKHRNGPTKTIVVAFQGHYSRFANMAHEGF
ncbi:replicative DNA helicase [Kocuria sp. ZOR0020]|uniref:replicative DNA helicase n=1 Tax=Kocuria sp. ZOR0020 TaxID=1339234 RepID=UPI000648C63C|nr:replicative DNA helicase [Kocuria sp. ZOR0020]